MPKIGLFTYFTTSISSYKKLIFICIISYSHELFFLKYLKLSKQLRRDKSQQKTLFLDFITMLNQKNLYSYTFKTYLFEIDFTFYMIFFFI